MVSSLSNLYNNVIIYQIKKKSWEQFCLWTNLQNFPIHVIRALDIDVFLYPTLTIQAIMPTGFFIWGYMYPFTFIFGGTSKFLGVQCTPLTLHLGIQWKLTAFSPRKVVHHVVFCKYYAELAKTFFFLSDIGSDRKWGSLWPMAFVSVPPFFCNIVYNLSNFVCYTELNARFPIYSHDH